MKYFVKFVPYNENTLSTLINKTIKFSTVYEFNDFNELAYYGTDCNGKEEVFWNTFYTKIEDNSFRDTFLQNINKASQYTIDYLNDFKNKFYNHTKENPTLCSMKDYQIIIEIMVYTSVGMFCVSHLNVFCDDSAQLMFAHYGDSLRGIALVYEIHPPNGKKLETVSYDKDRVSGGPAFDWINGNYSDMQNFLKKSQKWGYEQESRMFHTPNIACAVDHGVELKAILYTSRFSSNFNTLASINKDIYGDRLYIQAIRPNNSISVCKFVINGGDWDGQCVLNLFLNQPETKTPGTSWVKRIFKH